MLFVPAERRTELLRPLLPEQPEPGSQGGFHFLDQVRAGDAWISEDRRTGLVTTGRSAWVYGRPDPDVGRFLGRIGHRGPVHGAVSSIDPRQALGSHDPVDVRRYVVLVSDEAPERALPETDLAIRPPRPEDRDGIAGLDGSWVLDLWEDPTSAPFAVVCENLEGRLVGLGGARTMSDTYAEIAAWLEPGLRTRGLAPAWSHQVFEEVLAAGLTMTGVVREEHMAALRSVEKLGWEEAGTAVSVHTGSVRAARDAERMGALERARTRTIDG